MCWLSAWKKGPFLYLWRLTSYNYIVPLSHSLNYQNTQPTQLSPPKMTHTTSFEKTNLQSTKGDNGIKLPNPFIQNHFYYTILMLRTLFSRQDKFARLGHPFPTLKMWVQYRWWKKAEFWGIFITFDIQHSNYHLSFSIFSRGSFRDLIFFNSYWV